MSVKPIRFTADEVLATLAGRKSTKRLVVKPANAKKAAGEGYRQGHGLWIDLSPYNGDREGHIKDYSVSPCWFTLGWYVNRYAPYRPDDVLWVRETWNFGYIETSDVEGSYDAWFEEWDWRTRDQHSYLNALSRFWYKADEDAVGDVRMPWRPSIHMPREAARIWLRVTDVRVERLQDCGNAQAKDEGCTCCSQFVRIWASTIKPADRDRYGWLANPWVWRVEFERCEKPEEG